MKVYATTDRCDAHSDALHAHCDTIGDNVSEIDRLRVDNDAAPHRQADLEVSQSVGGFHQMLSTHQIDFASAAAPVAAAATQRSVYHSA